MEEPIEEVYFNWLCAKVLSEEIQTYYDLLWILHTTEFVWLLPGDKNRAEDAVELRHDFRRELYLDVETEWLVQPASLLELFIALAKRAQFQTDMPVKDWFWIFIINLGLDNYRQVSDSDQPIIEDILYAFIWRTYRRNGEGGIFPMRTPKSDQRKVELWYQFHEYLDDQDLV